MSDFIDSSDRLPKLDKNQGVAPIVNKCLSILGEITEICSNHGNPA